MLRLLPGISSVLISTLPVLSPAFNERLNRLITIRLRAVPFNITVQAYAQTSDYDVNEIEKNLWPTTECHWSDIKEGHSCTRRLECKSGQGYLWKVQGNCKPFCNDNTNERGHRLLEFATFNDLVLEKTPGHHKAFRRWTWHSPNG